MNAGKAQRGSMWVLASGVAVIAAITSYSHIYDLGRAHGGSGTPARLLPLSVDMLILVGELMLLHEADDKDHRFVLGWVLVWSGILATLAANVTYGAQYGILGALIWGWPAYSFILAAGGMVAVVKRAADDHGRSRTTAHTATATTASDSRDDEAALPATGADRVRAILSRDPRLAKADVAALADVSLRTVERVKRELALAGANGHDNGNGTGGTT